MVVLGKVFRLTKLLPIAEFFAKLYAYHKEEAYEEGDYNFALITEVTGLISRKEKLIGFYSHDYTMHVFHRGKNVPLPRTIEAIFNFAQVDNRILLTIVEKKRVANFIANKLSEIVFTEVGSIVEARIPPETLRNFHLNNPEDTKITFFYNVNVPNVDKLSLYNPDLINAHLFTEYSKDGDLWYVVARSKGTGYVVGVTRDASVTIFNLTDKNKYVDYVNKEICPIILESS